MTTENVLFSNHVVVVGMLDTMMVRDRNANRDKERGRPILIETTRKEGRTRGVGGRWENLILQVGSPYGGMFALPIELSPDVLGIELLDSAAAETMLAIEGSLPLRQTFDGRFATDRLDARNRSDRGRPTRELQLRVSLVRTPNTDERRASSAVWLEGVVAEPPQVSRHPNLPAIQLASTILKVAFARPLDFPGVAATIDEIVDVNVAIPTSHRTAPLRAKQGGWISPSGWSAWTFVAGRPASKEDVPSVIAAIRAFHHALAQQPYPAYLATRDTPYDRADQAAWDTPPDAIDPHLVPLVSELLRLRQPIAPLRAQLIHGDLNEENILVAPGVPPAINDLTPYWHPPEFALAVLAYWLGPYRGDMSILRAFAQVQEFDQLLVRAALRTIFIAHEFSERGGSLETAAKEYQTSVAIIAEWMNQRERL